VKCHEIEVALDDDGPSLAPDRLERPGKAEERAPLVKNRALRGIEVLGFLVLADGAPAEADHPAAHVADRERHAAA